MTLAAFPEDDFPEDGFPSEFSDDESAGLDFSILNDFHIPDDLSELDNAPPPIVHEDEVGNIYEEPNVNLDAELAAITGESRELALLLTPVIDARPLAAVLALVGIGADCVPTPSGAVVVLPDKDGDQPNQAAKALSRALAQTSILLVTKATGQLTAERYTAGVSQGEVPAGLIVAGASGVVEDLLVGAASARELPGVVTSVGLTRAKAMLWLGAAAGSARGRRSAPPSGGASGGTNGGGSGGHNGTGGRGWRGRG